MHHRILLSAQTLGAMALGLILLCARTGNAQEMAVLTDTTGATVNFKTFKVNLPSGTGDLPYKSLGLFRRLYGHDIYEQAMGIPIRQASGAFQFVTFDKISEYQVTGKTATIILVNGERFVGSPLAGCTFRGESGLGEVSVPAEQARTLKFNPNRAKQYLEEEEKEFRRNWSSIADKGWPAEYTARATLTLASGDELRLQHVAFVYETTVTGCDDSYIPCKRWSRAEWWGKGKMPVKFGALQVELDFTKTQSMEFAPPSKPGIAPISFEVTLRTGEKIKATLSMSDGDKPIALLGTTEHGYAHVPLERIKLITFLDGT